MSTTESTIPIQVRKNTGELVPFDEGKLGRSLQRSGAKEEEIDEIIAEVRASLFDGITTRKIYQIAYRILAKQSNRAAGRFRLKKAIFQFGPSGYPFEHFIARLLEQEGFTVKTGQLVEGRCVTHEVDVVAEKPGKTVMVECKFHHVETRKSDVKISLYVHSRFEDIKAARNKNKVGDEESFQPFLITNTRFTEDAVQFGECSGMTLISWDYPAGNSLKDWIDRSGFHPITTLKSLQKNEKQMLLDKGIVLCREIAEDHGLLAELQISNSRKKKILKEAAAML